MTSRDVLILLSSKMCVSDKIVPFSNSEIQKLLLKLRQRDLNLIDLYGKNEDELHKIFMNDFNKTNEKKFFIERICSLMKREGSLSFYMANIDRLYIKILTIFDDDYPQILKDKLGDKAPVLLYYRGNINLLKNKIIGFSGSRKEKNPNVTFEWAKFAIDNGFTIINGGAKGVDSYSTKSAIDNKGTFIEFLSGSLIERLKIPQIIDAVDCNRALILSEAIPDAPFNVGTAMARNKFIYLLSKYVIIPNASYKIKRGEKCGGTWSGAIENINSSYKNLLVVSDQRKPWNIELIKMGAYPITNIKDKKSTSVILQNENIYMSLNKNNDNNAKLIKILKSPRTLGEINFTKKELSQMNDIISAVNDVKYSLDELNLPKKIKTKIISYCQNKIDSTEEQLNLFDFIK